MPRWPAGLHRYAGSMPNTGGISRRIRATGVDAYRPLIRSPIIAVAQAIVNGAGVAVVQAGPVGLGTRWYPVKVDISTTTGAVDVSTAVLYKSLISVSTQIGGTSYAGGGDTFGTAGEELQQGEFLIVVWAGAVPGDQATMRVTGEQLVMTAGPA